MLDNTKLYYLLEYYYNKNYLLLTFLLQLLFLIINFDIKCQTFVLKYKMYKYYLSNINI